MSLYVFICPYMSFSATSIPATHSLPQFEPFSKISPLVHLFSFYLFIYLFIYSFIHCRAPIIAGCICVDEFFLSCYFCFIHVFFFAVADYCSVHLCRRAFPTLLFLFYSFLFFAVHRLLRCASAFVNTRRGKCPPQPN